MKILTYVARHGKTTDSDKNIFRGNRDSKLNKQGFKDAGDLQDFFKDREFGTIFSSDLTRAIQTGHMIGEPHDKVPHVCKDLKPWDIGVITGKDKDEWGDKMKHYIDNPHAVIPQGESRHEFERERVDPLLVEAIQMGLEDNKPPVIIGHSSIIHALAHLLYGEKSDHSHMAVKPGGIVIVYLEDGEVKAKAVFKKGVDDSSYAYDKKKTSPTS